MLSERDENLNTLMILTGLSEDDASQLLSHRVKIVSSDQGVFPLLARDVTKLLERTLVIAAPTEECDLELAIDQEPSADAPIALVLSLTDESMVIQPRSKAVSMGTRTIIAGLTRKGCACFAAGFVLSRLLGDNLPYKVKPIFEFRFADLGFPIDEFDHHIDLSDSVLAGGGGVASGFLWALEELKLSGKLAIVDPKKIRSGNANRCLYFSSDDNGYKADVLADRVNLPGVAVTSFAGTLHDYVATRSDKRICRLFSTADSRNVRRSFQNELPLEVFDASTTDVSEVIVHSHVQPNRYACLSCIYPHIEDETHRAKHIAATLGLELAEVQLGFIDDSVATKLVANFPQRFQRSTLIGIAFDSLYKALCGEQALLTPAMEQAAAPFAFVSNLAGVLLALELFRYEIESDRWSRSNYLCISPWVPPHALVRRLRGRLPHCEFCSKSETVEALRAVWPDVNWDAP